MLKYFSFIIVLAMLFSIEIQAKEKIYTDCKKTIVAKVNSEFVIKLGANHTTGFQWMAAEPIDSTVIKLIDKDYETDKAPEGMTGVGGNEYWAFRALKKGSVKLKLKEVRPWESNDPAANHKVFTIKVK
jgi:predicted secreted protein